MKETTGKLTFEERYSVLEISQQKFGVEVKNVKEILPLPKITRIPNLHESILGVFNLRGQIYSLLDLRVFLRLGNPVLSERNMVVILEYDNISFGTVVDKVLDVINLDSTKIRIPARDMSSQYVQYLSGYYEHKKSGVIYILDLGAIVNAREIRQYRY